jgi:DNA-directed RNA polymerase subunit RPC12/RpoP
MIKNVAIIASAALLLAGTIISTIGIFIAYSAQVKEKEVYEAIGQNQEDFNNTKKKILDTIKIRNDAFATLGSCMRLFGCGIVVFTLSAYPSDALKGLKKRSEEPKKIETLTRFQEPPTITLRCRACGSLFTVEKKKKKFKVECQFCGRKGIVG